MGAPGLGQDSCAYLRTSSSTGSTPGKSAALLALAVAWRYVPEYGGGGVKLNVEAPAGLKVDFAIPCISAGATVESCSYAAPARRPAAYAGGGSFSRCIHGHGCSFDVAPARALQALRFDWEVARARGEEARISSNIIGEPKFKNAIKKTKKKRKQKALAAEQRRAQRQRPPASKKASASSRAPPPPPRAKPSKVSFEEQLQELQELQGRGKAQEEGVELLFGHPPPPPSPPSWAPATPPKRCKGAESGAWRKKMRRSHSGSRARSAPAWKS